MKDNWHAEKAGKWESFWKDEAHDPSAPYLLTECVEIFGEERKELELDVVVEESIKLILDGRHLVTLLALPRELRELAAGFLVCEGVLKGIGDIHSIQERGKLWRRTGGTHSSLICTEEGDIVSFCEDVSRACSVDKAAGAALLSGRERSDSALVTTGRLSGGMVAKAARAGIPIVVSRAAPLSTGVLLSKKMNTLMTLKEALEKIKKLKSTYYFRRQSEKVTLNDSVGRELSEDIIADSISPAFDIAAMDGFAVRCEDVYPLKISGRVYAGDSIVKLKSGEAMAIATGAILPEGAEAVLKMEDAEAIKDLLYGKTLRKWENVFRKGSDYSTGDRIFEKNHRIMPQSAALLYSLGIEKVPVYKKIRAGIISTGTEIYNGMIKNTSAMLIQGFMKEMGCESEFFGSVPDDFDRTKKILQQACEEYDVVFTTGGVSVGERDFVADIIAKTGELLFHRVAIRPGKPLAVGIVNGTPVFALPGKPTGAFTALEMVVRSYFTDMPRAVHKLAINEDVVLPEKGFEYILFVKIANNTAIGYGREMKLFDREYNTAMVSASPRSSVVEGYVITDRDIGKGELVNVYLFY